MSPQQKGLNFIYKNVQNFNFSIFLILSTTHKHGINFYTHKNFTKFPLKISKLHIFTDQSKSHKRLLQRLSNQPLHTQLNLKSQNSKLFRPKAPLKYANFLLRNPSHVRSRFPTSRLQENGRFHVRYFQFQFNISAESFPLNR